MREVSVTRVNQSGCANHLNLVLHDREADRYLRVEIEAEAGRAILCDLSGVATAEGRLMDLGREFLEAAGGRIERLELTCQDGDFRALITVCSPAGERTIDADPCWAVAMACRLKVPILVPGPDELGAQGGVPEVFRSALDGLDLGHL